MTDTDGIILADGGIETALADRLGQDLPEFAAFVLLDSEEGRSALREYYRPFVDIARAQGRSLVLDTPTWRASADWGDRLGYDAAALAAANREAVALVRGLVEREVDDFTVTVNGCVGPRTDDANGGMTPDEAEAYHRPQIAALAAAGADRITAVTASGADEAIGIVRAARSEGAPVAVSFGLGPDGRLLDGRTLAAGIAAVDAATDAAAEMFMVNCAHPAEVGASIADEAELARVVGLRLNAAHHGDDGPGDAPEQFAAAVWALCERLPAVRILGGCCGTDAPHIEAIARLAGEIAPGAPLRDLLLEQFDWHWGFQIYDRLAGLSDAEYFWEPVADCWSVRPRGTSDAAVQAGSGDMIIEFAFPEPEPVPVTTIAWRLGHIIVGVLAMRSASHFDRDPVDYESFAYAGTAEEALRQLDDELSRWRTGILSLSDADLARPCGPAEGRYADRSFATLILHINRELIHHFSEISLLRDLYLREG